MIATDIVSLIREQISSDIGIEPIDANHIAVVTPFLHADGDRCGFDLTRDYTTGLWTITDDGEVLAHASYSGIDLLGSGRIDRLRRTADFFGVHESDGALTMRVTDNSKFGNSLFTFAQACLEIGRQARLPSERSSSEPHKFREKLIKAVEDAVPSTHRTRRWHHPVLDPNKVYRADYFVERRRKRSLMIFGVPTDYASLKAAVAAMHYRQLNLQFVGVAICEDESRLKADSATLLGDAFDRVFPSIDERGEIEEFLKDAA